MISGLAQAYTVTKDCAYLEAAKKAATFVKSALYDGHKGTLLRNAYRDDKGYARALKKVEVSNG